MNLTKYAQNLEHIIRFKNKEIQRLEYINKYLVISQQKRDEMLTHTLEENRKLKEMSLRMERKFPEKKVPLQFPSSPTGTSAPKNMLISQPSAKIEETLAPRKSSTLNLRTIFLSYHICKRMSQKEALALVINQKAKNSWRRKRLRVS